MSDDLNLTASEQGGAPVTDVIGAADYTKYDVSSEQYRFYTYPNGDVFRITGPVDLYITKNGSHRVVDVDGVTHRPERGYVGISWKQSNGKPFDF